MINFRLKPGAQHLKLKQELEEKIAEQRSLEWAKRLEEERQLHKEMDTILDDADEADESIDKIEAKLDEPDAKDSSESEEEELLEDDVEIKDKPRKHNPMLDDEAEESDIDDNEDGTELKENNEDEIELKETNDEEELGEGVAEGDEEDEESSEEEESSESEAELESTKTKKGRILKAFEDSDDEDTTNKEDVIVGVKVTDDQNKVEKNSEMSDVDPIVSYCEVQSTSQGMFNNCFTIYY